MYLFFDTETTGLPNYKMPVDADSQPHICQLGAILTNSEGHVKAELNAIIRPDGWTIPEEASKIHGITMRDTLDYGFHIRGVMAMFTAMVKSCDIIIAHNIKFDQRMIEREGGAEIFSLKKDMECTMEMARSILKIPPTERMMAAGFNDFKQPNLQEAYTHFFGKPFEGAHDAMADVRACRDVFFKMKA